MKKYLVANANVWFQLFTGASKYVFYMNLQFQYLVWDKVL